MELKDRERKIDVSQMSQEQIDVLSIQIGDKMREICGETAERVNAILKVYGMSAKIAIAFEKLPKEMEKSLLDKPQKGKKSKKDNLKKAQVI